MRELELKLSVDDPFVTPALRPDGVDVAGMEELPPLDLRATYFDTADLRLARHGATLRYRTGEGDESGWHLKLPVPGDDGASRDELHFDGPAGKVPAAARDLVTPFVAFSAARSRWRDFALAVAAGACASSDGRELAELVDDRVAVIKQGRIVERFRELELESRALDRPALERIAARASGSRRLRPAPCAQGRARARRPSDADARHHRPAATSRPTSPPHTRCRRRSCAACSASSPTTRARVWAKWSPCTRCGSARDGCAATCARSRRCWTRRGRNGCATSCNGWAPHSGRLATWT